MDKLNASDLVTSLSDIKQNVIYATPRYSEITCTAEEPGLVSADFWMMKVPGMTASLWNIKPQTDLLLMDSQDGEFIESAFILNGSIDSTFNNRPARSAKNTHAFQYTPTMEAEHKIGRQNLEAMHINFELNFFRSIVSTSECRPLDDLFNCLEKKQQFLAPPSLLPLQARMNDIIFSIRNCGFNSLTRAIFIEAKLLELFALQIEQIAQTKTPSTKAICSKEDQAKLFAVREFIENNYLQPLSLAQITTLFGLNEFKLKKGYKSLFNTTVFGHIYNLRMQKAMQLLSQKKMTIGEIADLVGYANIGSFSSEFKKKFGFSPSKA